MAEYKHGEMDITEQKRTFAATMTFGTWAIGIIIVALIFLALVGA